MHERRGLLFRISDCCLCRIGGTNNSRLSSKCSSDSLSFYFSFLSDKSNWFVLSSFNKSVEFTGSSFIYIISCFTYWGAFARLKEPEITGMMSTSSLVCYVTIYMGFSAGILAAFLLGLLLMVLGLRCYSLDGCRLRYLTAAFYWATGVVTCDPFPLPLTKNLDKMLFCLSL